MLYLCPLLKTKVPAYIVRVTTNPLLSPVLCPKSEKLIYDHIAYSLTTCRTQFGFKTKHSMDMCIYMPVLKYCSLNSNVYSCFLDAPKAFDRVNHYVLFEKLIKQGTPLYIVRILVFWYTTKTMYVHWKYIMSDSFSVTNGVRHGGVLSLYVFCVYMDDLSKKK